MFSDGVSCNGYYFFIVVRKHIVESIGDIYMKKVRDFVRGEVRRKGIP